MPELTYGQKLVEIDLNTDSNQEIYNIKLQAARLIDDINKIRNDSDNPACKRSCSISITEIETGCMYAVKGILDK